MISKIKSVPLLFRKTMDFYRKNGIRLTFLEIQNRLVRRILNSQSFIHQDLHYQYLIDKFPKRFEASHNIIDWNTRVALAAQLDLQDLLLQLNINVESEMILSLIKNNFGEDRYLHLLDNIFSLAQLRNNTHGSKPRQLIQASRLPGTAETKARRRILFVTSQFPNPQNGGGNRVLNFIKILSEKNDIYLSTCFIPEDDEKALQLIKPYCYAIQKIPLWNFGGNQAEIRKWLNGVAMDIVHYEWPSSLENYDPVYGKHHIFTYMEAASLRVLMDMEKLKPYSDVWLHQLVELIYTLHLELVASSRLSARIAVTTKDGDFFRSLYPYQEYVVLNHGVTFDEFELPDVEPEPHTLVFVGNFQHYPNVAAMEYFFREIWSGILREMPDTCICLVGPKPPKEITIHANGRQVIITGAVADIRPYIQKASVCVAPLITGAGMRGKVIDYAALRRTFVATSIATTDLVFRDNVDYLCADTAQEFAQKTVTLLRDKIMAKQMANAAYEKARENYDTRRLTDFLLRLYKYLED